MPLIPFAPRMTDDGAREPASVTRVVAVDRAGCARVAGRLHVAHNPSVLGLGFEEISPGEISSHAGIARCYSGERMKISCIGSPRVRGTISVFVFLLSFFVVIVHAPKGLSTLAAAARATSTGASSSADGASEAAYSTAALAAASLAAIAAKVWTGTSAHTPVVPRHMHPSYTRESRAGSSTCTPRPLAATPQRALRQLHRLLSSTQTL